MIGMSSSGKDAIKTIIEEMFDKLALGFLGHIPRLAHKKYLAISGKPNLGLAHLFVQSMANKSPNIFEQDALKSLLESTYGYIDSLKSRTQSNLTESIDGIIKEAKAKGSKIDEAAIQQVVAEEMKKAKSHMKTIAESESTKIRNVGRMMDITRVASSINDSDPLVFFVIVRDKTTCKECLRLHMMPDGVTPRVWRFSELKQSYHKRGNDAPSAFGLHPHCRCTLTYIAKGFGFNKKGKITYIKENHDQYAAQEA
jgi:hypothetical protein